MGVARAGPAVRPGEKREGTGTGRTTRAGDAIAYVCLPLLPVPVRRQCVGMCECIPERDMPNEHVTVHFSCIQNGINKPGGYETEKQ